MDDPYDRAHQLALQKMKKDQSLEGENKFRPNSFHPNVFNKDIKIYGEDVELKEVIINFILENSKINKIQYF